MVVFSDVASSASATDSELSHADSELSDSDNDSENEQQDELEDTAKYIHVALLYWDRLRLSPSPHPLPSSPVRDPPVHQYLYQSGSAIVCYLCASI